MSVTVSSCSRNRQSCIIIVSCIYNNITAILNSRRLYIYYIQKVYLEGETERARGDLERDRRGETE